MLLIKIIISLFINFHVFQSYSQLTFQGKDFTLIIILLLFKLKYLSFLFFNLIFPIFLIFEFLIKNENSSFQSLIFNNKFSLVLTFTRLKSLLCPENRLACFYNIFIQIIIYIHLVVQFTSVSTIWLDRFSEFLFWKCIELIVGTVW